MRILFFLRFGHVCKPDPEIFRLTPDITQAPAQQLVYIDTPMFVNL
jgi:FMN phosphatase YigB (HAD superfamily)